MHLIQGQREGSCVREHGHPHSGPSRAASLNTAGNGRMKLVVL